MAKIPFDIKFRSQIESGEYSVVTGDDKPVRIICWDRHYDNQHPIVALAYDAKKDIEIYINASVLGEAFSSLKGDNLFIVTPEPELTEFEKAVKDLCWKVGMGEVVYKDDIIKKTAVELLELARKELIEEQYTSDPRKSDLYKLGKAEALKDLPRWEKYPHNGGSEPLVNGILQKDGSYKWRLYLDGYKIEISDIEKLPGFKEGEK